MALPLYLTQTIIVHYLLPNQFIFVVFLLIAVYFIGNQTNDTKNIKLSPKIRPVKKITKVPLTPTHAVKAVFQDKSPLGAAGDKLVNHIKDTGLNLITALQASPKIMPVQSQVQPHSHVVVQKAQPSAVVQPSVAVPSQTSMSGFTHTHKAPVQTKMQETQTQTQVPIFIAITTCD